MQMAIVRQFSSPSLFLAQKMDRTLTSEKVRTITEYVLVKSIFNQNGADSSRKYLFAESATTMSNSAHLVHWGGVSTLKKLTINIIDHYMLGEFAMKSNNIF